MYLSVAVEVHLPLFKGHRPVVVQVEILEAGNVHVGRVGVHIHVLQYVIVELDSKKQQRMDDGGGGGGGTGRRGFSESSTWRTPRLILSAYTICTATVDQNK